MKKILLFLILVFLATPKLVLANESKVYCSGLAIAEDISEDENGLIVLDGLFSITNFKKFPGVDTFFVYSRWTGGGKHTAKLQILDPDDKIIADSEDLDLEIEGESETVYYKTKFDNVVFQKPGVHWIEAILDGKKESLIPLFIQKSEESIEFEDYPESPVLIFALPTVGGIYEKDNGLQVISGVFEYFYFDRFPSAYDFTIATGWYSGEGEFKHQVEILDPDNNSIYKSEAQTFVNGPKTINVLNDNIEDFIFQKPGEYTINIYLDDKLIQSFPLLVKTQQ